MAVYCDKDLQFTNDVDSGSIDVYREGDISYQPASVDLHLADEYTLLEDTQQPIDVTDESTYPDTDERTDVDEIPVKPQQFVLARTDEWIELDGSVIGFLDGRSSVGRMGLFVENAGLVDPGFSGTLTLELFNATQNTIVLQPDMRIVQLTVQELTDTASVDYAAKRDEKYDEQLGVTPSRLYNDFD